MSLLNTRKKRVAAAVVSVSVLTVAAALLYFILRSKGKTLKASTYYKDAIHPTYTMVLLELLFDE